MNGRSKQFTQKLVAIIVIVAILNVIGVSTAIIAFLLVVGFLVWRATQYSDSREIERMFEFYIAADEILRDEERQWYGFEISEVIHGGEHILDSIADPPPLVYFALGALYHRIGDYQQSNEYLAALVEDSAISERQRAIPSPQLRRYVETLRGIERDPANAPKSLAAIRNLERARRRRATELLAKNREMIRREEEPAGSPLRDTSQTVSERANMSGAKSVTAMNAPRPIAEVLQDVYQEDKKTA